jgi:GNAT superfamily N-acetyltransferase
MEIRAFQAGDKLSLSEIYLNCRQITFSWVPKEEFQEADFDRDTKGEVILVATLNSMPVGFISIWMRDNFIYHLFIDPDHQGKGYGRRLLIAGLKNLGRPSRLKCVVRNSKACKFLNRMDG